MGWTSVFKHLLADADLIYDKRCKHGKLAQHYAAHARCAGVMELLVQDGRFDLRDSDNYMRETVLKTAVRYGRLEIVTFLLGISQMDLNTANVDQENPLTLRDNE
jgi:Ankyrin repeats (3 copies)